MKADDRARARQLSARARRLLWDVQRCPAIATTAPGYGTYRLQRLFCEEYVGRREAGGYGLTLEEVEAEVAALAEEEARRRGAADAKRLATERVRREAAARPGYEALMRAILRPGE